MGKIFKKLFGAPDMAPIVIPPPTPPAPRTVEAPPATVAEQIPPQAVPTVQNAEVAIRQRQTEEQKRQAIRRARSRQESIIAGRLGNAQANTATKSLLGA